jgi:hypothetical protein
MKRAKSSRPSRVPWAMIGPVAASGASRQAANRASICCSPTRGARPDGHSAGLPSAAVSGLISLTHWPRISGAHSHHLDATAVTILATVTIPLSTLWLTRKTYKATRIGSADDGAGPGVINAGPGSAVADRGGTAVGQGAVVLASPALSRSPTSWLARFLAAATATKSLAAAQRRTARR